MRALAIAALLAQGCGFAPTAIVTDAPVDVVSIDAPEMFPASCNAIHIRSPSLPSGAYKIDPDGPGGGSALSVTCDMTTEGGGWTIVFFSSSSNLTTAPAYTASTPRLLADAQTALVAYRDAAQVAVPSYATFDLPDAWRTTAPFGDPGTDLSVTVNVDGVGPYSSILRYGMGTFGPTCFDPWTSSSPLGRICLANTTAPFYAGFADSSADYCNSGTQSYNTLPCSNDRRFSIAIR